MGAVVGFDAFLLADLGQTGRHDLFLIILFFKGIAFDLNAVPIDGVDFFTVAIFFAEGFAQSIAEKFNAFGFQALPRIFVAQHDFCVDACFFGVGGAGVKHRFAEYGSHVDVFAVQHQRAFGVGHFSQRFVRKAFTDGRCADKTGNIALLVVVGTV